MNYSIKGARRKKIKLDPYLIETCAHTHTHTLSLSLSLFQNGLMIYKKIKTL